MKPRHSNSAADAEAGELQAEQDAPEALSRTKRKEAVEALQELGEKLVTLPKDKLDKLGLPETLRDAVLEARRITSNGAIRRQMQYIGRLMREVDTEPIADQLHRWEGKHTAENARFHQLERWRERLLKEEAALAEFMRLYPQTNSKQLRTLIRNSQRETAANRPPKSSRDLFRLLREITESGPNAE
ncbi:MAG TPA: ribosome biogenesis factor YjgA [Methylophilaceae bacterium]|nr:ribosome biogenesis factor YjgA [Methylophilaceae bacterium]